MFRSHVVLDFWERALPEEEMERLKTQLRREELKYAIYCMRMGALAFMVIIILICFSWLGLFQRRFIVLLSFLVQVLVSKTVDLGPTQGPRMD
ncbi:hypothetical protein A0H81_02484 [Grifola frondosa]|uniref:Uncharacterized protein n=1 Tax=Grifola frondosa TaxID=5627 RepID=A0A1C7MMX8_GRIFR|nr:hypothetical protein A0H81_02484 [Grifola frondosa]